MGKPVGWRATEGTLDYYELIRGFQEALYGEIETTKTKAPDFNFDLKDGAFVFRSLDYYIYRFHIKRELKINDDTPVNFFVNNKNVDGFVITSNENSIDISIPEDCGPVIKLAKATSNRWILYENLNDRFDEIRCLPSEYNIIGCMKLFGFTEPSLLTVPGSFSVSDSLNADQKMAVIKALTQEITFIWGPPGTGKTKTLSTILNNLIRSGKTILLLSHTNLALDEVLKKFAEGPENRPLIEAGQVIRHDNITDPNTVLDNFRLDNIRERKIGQGYEQIASLKNEIRRYEITINDYSIVAESEEYRDLKWYEDELEVAKTQADILRKEYVGIIIRDNDLKKNGPELSGIKGTASSLEEVNTLSSRWEAAEKYVLELKKKIGKIRTHLVNSDYLENGEDLDHLPGKIDQLKEKIYALQSRVELIEKEIIIDKGEIFDKARVIGCTLTKSYIDRSIFTRHFDVMILDEASMASLPSVFFAAGLASQYVISGDFRQLSPIARSSAPSVKKWLKRDIFEQSGITVSVNSRREDSRLVMLREQYRMHPQIAEIINKKMYNGQLVTNEQTTIDRTQIAALLPFEGQSVVLCDTSNVNPWSSYAANGSKMNLYSALLSTRLAEMAIDGGLKSIGIITPYRQQVKVIERLLGERKIDRDIVSVTTIHKAQGRERDCIIIDLVEGPPHNVGRMLNAPSIDSDTARLLNVAISRARGKLILVVNKQYFTDRSRPGNFVRELLDEISQRGTTVEADGILSHYPASIKQAIPANVEQATIIEGITGSQPEMAEVASDSKQVIYDAIGFYKAFMDDIDKATSRVVIFSPFIARKRMGKLTGTLKSAVGRGVEVYLIVRAPKEDSARYTDIIQLIDETRANGIKVILATEHSGIHKGFHEKIALIDNSVFYFGSLNILSHSDSSESMFAFTNPETISDLVKYFKIDSIIQHYEVNDGQPRTTQIHLEVIENTNGLADALFTFGKAQIRHEKYEDAIKSIRDAIRIDSSASEYHYYLSTILLKLGVKDEAVTEINKAIELSPENDEYRKLKII